MTQENIIKLPVGWIAVPVEPTSKMLDQGGSCHPDYTKNSFGQSVLGETTARFCWNKMLSQIPKLKLNIDCFGPTNCQKIEDWLAEEREKNMNLIGELDNAMDAIVVMTHVILEASQVDSKNLALTIQWPDGTETVEIVSENVAKALGFTHDEYLSEIV